MLRFLLVASCYLILALPLQAQISPRDESLLLAETKQLSQFMRRFNGEEDAKGNRLYEGDRKWRDRNLRRKYLPLLIDRQKSWDTQLLRDFEAAVVQKQLPVYLDLHSGNWLADVQASFEYEGAQIHGRLLMRLQEEPVGSRWVIDQVWLPPFSVYAVPDTTDAGFLHPLSHELAFMNLRKVLLADQSPYAYLANSERLDQLSLFRYELQRGRLRFVQVDGLSFHFFLQEGWYFELAYQNRKDYNRGWLIVNLLQVPSGAQEHFKQQLLSLP